MALLLPLTYTVEPMTAIVMSGIDVRGRRVWRLDSRHPDSYARDERRRRDGDRRLRDETAGEGR
jgi:hypothetical protein